MSWLTRIIAELLTICLLLAGTAYIGWWAVWPAAILIGTRAHALGILAHLGSHRLTDHEPKVNDMITWLCFRLIGLDLLKYRRFHGLHHQHLSIPGKDPEVEIINKLGRRWKDGYQLTHSVKDLCGLHVGEAMLVMSYMATPSSLLFSMLPIIALAFISLPAAAALALAAPTGMMFAHRLRAWNEHNHPYLPGYTKQQPRPALWRRALFLPHGAWQHYEHHVDPKFRPL